VTSSQDENRMKESGLWDIEENLSLLPLPRASHLKFAKGLSLLFKC